MRTIEYTKKFRRDYKRESKGIYKQTLALDIKSVIQLLERDASLPQNYYDHALKGDWHDHRDCHIKPDLILIYRRPNETTLQLVRLGSHSQLGL
ncbi:type II toxin-antitoxin system YafQ family toxin [Polynucleobacter sp. MWH-Braz-FAM2G]|uniref:type II toxin-antitoxin system YafQ family toxin n=1 Tax=Polynucleobacter sp. MWH-Braz-FAM2G TaxID=1855883 RepID=UPI001BFE2AA8|nr:type II toxin-antitoxin system YafQ family toxin [Polynucleobacter sp. MWH-Braz-FAM2G]QWD91453.1 type II toxin-antitoxin system YafQ family toxin [Polynucleobacter sp. MWH-Braz-FAM2G]